LFVKDGTTTVVDADNVGHTGQLGAVDLYVGDFTVGELGYGGTDLGDYGTTISGDCLADGSVSLGLDEHKICTITNTALHKVIVLVCHQGSGTLAPSEVELNGSLVTSIGVGDLPDGVTEADVCGLPDSKSFKDLSHGTHHVDVHIHSRPGRPTGPFLD
jgi:hypothetical protein